MAEVHVPRAPLFRDPIYDGAADPTVIWNHEEQAWWLLYTNRRANQDCPGFSWVHGTDIGIASSSDGGRNWLYRGILDRLNIDRGRNTYWAPEVIWNDGVYHMYVSYIQGVPEEWSGCRRIAHMTSQNLWDWQFESFLPHPTDMAIDACVHQMPSGVWRLWYKDEKDGAHTHALDSRDLYSWEYVGPVITDCAHEGPNVFHWRGQYWMITDPWCGLGVYCSPDAEEWVRQRNILDSPGTRQDDGGIGGHADVLVQGDDAYVFYFTHPEREVTLPGPVPGVMHYAHRRTSLQVARLEVQDGILTCDRDAPCALNLRSEYTEGKPRAAG